MFLLGVVAAGLAALAYGISTVLRALGARRAAVAARDAGTGRATSGSGGPSGAATLQTLRDPAFVIGTVAVVGGFVGGAVAARFLPLFLSQTIVSGNLVVTALLGTVVLGTRLHIRDWSAIAVVIASLCGLGIASSHKTHDDHAIGVHWGIFAATVLLSAGVLILVHKLGSRSALAAGAAAGTLFGVVAIGVRILHGIAPFDPLRLLLDPAAWTIAVAGVVGFYVQTVALQLGAVNGITAVLVVGEVAAPGVIGVAVLGDSAIPGRSWLAVVGFVGAVVGAIAVAWYGSADADHFGEAPPSEGGWRRSGWRRDGSEGRGAAVPVASGDGTDDGLDGLASAHLIAQQERARLSIGDEAETGVLWPADTARSGVYARAGNLVRSRLG